MNEELNSHATGQSGYRSETRAHLFLACDSWGRNPLIMIFDTRRAFCVSRYGLISILISMKLGGMITMSIPEKKD